MIGWDNGLALTRQQAITWTKCLVYWCIYASFGLNKLRYVSVINTFQTQHMHWYFEYSSNHYSRINATECQFPIKCEAIWPQWVKPYTLYIVSHHYVTSADRQGIYKFQNQYWFFITRMDTKQMGRRGQYILLSVGRHEFITKQSSFYLHLAVMPSQEVYMEMNAWSGMHISAIVHYT